jgi:hypothetical protein
MEPEGSLHFLQVPATCLNHKPDQSNPCSPSNFLKSHLNIILPFTPESSEWSLSLKFSHQNTVYTSSLLSSMRATCLGYLILFDLITRIMFGEERRSVLSLLCSFLHYPVTSSSYVQISSSAHYFRTPSAYIPP